MLEKRGGKDAEIAGLLFLAATAFELNFLVCFAVKNRFVKISWWILMSLISVILAVTILTHAK